MRALPNVTKALDIDEMVYSMQTFDEDDAMKYVCFVWDEDKVTIFMAKAPEGPWHFAQTLQGHVAANARLDG